MWRTGRGKRIAVQGLALLLAMLSLQPAVTRAQEQIRVEGKCALSLYKGETQYCIAKGKVKWSSKNPKIAQVKSTGGKYSQMVITGKAAGTTKVIGKLAKSKKKIVISVKVGNYITGMNLLSASSVTLSLDGTSQIKAKVTGKNPLYTDFIYTSGNKNIAKVSKKGKITAVSSGLTEITVATRGYNKKKKTYSRKVTVYVQSDDRAPEPTAVPLPSGDSTVIFDGNTGTASGSNLQTAISQLPAPADNQLMVGSFVVQSGQSQYTLYFLNRNYTGKMQLSVFGYPLSSSRKVAETLDEIVSVGNTAMYIQSEGERVLLVSDQKGNCAVERLSDQQIVNFQVYSQDPGYGTNYGLIVADGDTRDIIQVK